MKHTFSLLYVSFPPLSISLFLCHTLTLPCALSVLSFMGWSDGDNERLIITMKLSWFSAPLGAVGRAAAASEIVPSASPLIIWKHKFSQAGNLPVPSQTTVGSCTVCVHLSVLVNVCLREREREYVRERKWEEKTFSASLCVYQNDRACLCVWVCIVLLLLFLFSLLAVVELIIKVCIIWLGAEIFDK